jgi:hypothetical protein
MAGALWWALAVDGALVRPGSGWCTMADPDCGWCTVVGSICGWCTMVGPLLYGSRTVVGPDCD